jgi:hypothetical protein
MAGKQDPRRQEMDPLAALAGVAAALMEAGRYTRGGLDTAGRRAARASTDLGRRALANARDSRQRATIAFRVYRGEDLAPPVRPGRYVAIGAVTGVATAYAVVALGRLIRRGPDAGPGAKQLFNAVDWARTNTARVVRRTPPEPVAEADESVAERFGDTSTTEKAGRPAAE